MTYTVRISRAAQRQLGRIDAQQQDRIVAAVRGLTEKPRPSGVKKLRGRDAWRIRVGDYRVIYEIHDEELVVLVVAVGHRREVYDQLG